LLLHHQDALERVRSAGKPLFNVDVRIVDESSTSVEPGGTAELQVRGPNVMKGYWNRPELTAEAFTSDGWLRTGDAGRMDSEGYFWIVDRMENGFVSDGTLIYPGDIEKALLAHGGVEDAALIRVPDRIKGMVGAAVVVLADGAQITEADLLEACRKELTRPQVPYSITLVASIPRSSVGKVQRDEITALVSQRS
jgi:fatty-acyl-CoA synthase